MGNRCSGLLERRTVSTPRYAITLWVLFSALAPLLGITGCTGMVNGQKKTGASAVQVVPAAVDFGSTGVGKKVSHTAAVTNNGKATVTLTQASVSSSEFSISGLHFPLSILSGQTANFTVWFKGTKAGKAKGTLNLSGDTASPNPVELTGTAANSAPQLDISAGSIGFGNVATGVTNTQTVQIGNPSAVSVTITTANITGVGFSTSGLSLPLTLNAGQLSTFNVQFHPKAAAVSTGGLTLVSDATNSPSVIALTGTGVAAGLNLSVNPLSVNFGNITVGNTASRSITVTNTGNSNVAISNVSLTGAKLSLAGGSAVGLSPSQSITLTVQFAPTAAGAIAGSISIVSNASGYPAAIPVSGTGVTEVQHTVALSWNASSSATGYNVYRSVTSGGGYSKLNSSLDSALSYRDSTVQNSQTYFYVTTAVDSAGIESAFSSQVAVNIP